MAAKEGLSGSLFFNPHWIADPAWWFIEEQGDQARQQAARVQLELTRQVLTAQLQAVESLSKIVGSAAQG